jgi:hypothetical protein
MQGATRSTDPLAAPSIGAINFTAKALTIIDTSAWLDALKAVPGFADASFSSEALSENNGVVYYTVSASVQINDKALANRFAITKGK